MKLPAIFIIVILSACALAQGELGTLINSSGDPPVIQSNYGEQCNASRPDCFGDVDPSFCFWCPSDTIAFIQTDPDHYYAMLTNDSHFVSLPGGIGYCSNPHAQCRGAWNNDDYIIDMHGKFDNSDDDNKLYLQLTSDSLQLWKNVVTRNISEAYFDEHVNVISIEPQEDVLEYGLKEGVLKVGIFYVFSFDWMESVNPERDVITFKTNETGSWELVPSDEIAAEYDTHAAVKLVNREITSIITREEAEAKLAQCHPSMGINETGVSYENEGTKAILVASGWVNEGLCLMHTDKYTVYRGHVNLETGVLSCENYESPCVVYSTSPGSGFVPNLISENMIIAAVAVVGLAAAAFLLLKKKK